MVTAASAHGGYGYCPSNVLGLDFTKCVTALDIFKLRINESCKQDCCPLIDGLVDVDAAICLCKKLYVPGVVDITVGVRLILNECGKYCPDDFQCSKYI
ncbi:hypothetical protein BRADI_4g11997v3 [Brachypodium distachyon]|uniref:Hydrophobic seed protein domain-containing protein n=1 Tax=Brachypodium distachyon TaxID=15368 RepID=I1IJX7_BRADI|nr:hypothetical protein BRADI_4g11997v3 [Brachypodium distachyon]